MINSISTNQQVQLQAFKPLIILFLLFLFNTTATAQFKDNHNYALGGSVQASNDLDFLNLRFGKVLSKGNVLGLSVYADHDAVSGITAWYRISKELNTVSFPVFFKMDSELGYIEDDSFALFFRPGFTVPLTKQAYLDLSFAALQVIYKSDIETFISINNVGLGLVLGI